MKSDTCYELTDTWTNILTISTCVWNMSNHMVSVVLYGLTYLLFFKISLRWVSIVFDLSLTVYFRFQNYRNTDTIFISDNIVSFRFRWKKCESENDRAFRRSFSSLNIFMQTVQTMHLICSHNKYLIKELDSSITILIRKC